MLDKTPTLLLSPAEIRGYLDGCIMVWRMRRGQNDPLAPSYIDAFQSVRVSLFGELLTNED